MKILVLSDSHSSLHFMRQCIDFVKPDALIHLGDHYDDGETIHEEYPHIPLYQVAGNCDRYRCPPHAREILICPVCGVSLYMTHGHKQRVKIYLSELLRDAKLSHADAVLYGHTHEAYCDRTEDGMWILNPGSAGYGGRSAGLIETENGKIVNCRIIRQENLEERL